VARHVRSAWPDARIQLGRRKGKLLYPLTRLHAEPRIRQHHCTLPTSPLPASALAFDSRPASQHILVLAFPNNSIQVFDVESREFPAWARAVNEQLPYSLSRLQDPIAGIAFILDDVTDSIEASSAKGSRRSTSLASDRHNSRNVILWGRGWLCKLDLMGDAALNLSGPGLGGIRKRKQPFGSPSDTSKDHISARQVSAEKDALDQRPAQVVTKYRDIMLVDFLGPKEMIVVERPTVDILQNLRPAFYKPKYGSK
jgi:U3 small nucleolar RNA-associated protein 4